MMALFPARPLSLRMGPAEVLQPLASAALSWLLWQVEPSLREVLAPDPLGGSCEATFRGRPSGICWAPYRWSWAYGSYGVPRLRFLRLEEVSKPAWPKRLWGGA